MFENMTEEEARKAILTQVSAYCDRYHNKKSYKAGDRIPYAGRVYNSHEMENLVDSSLEFWLTAGRYTEQFEKEFAKFLKVKYVSLVNSGSSANLLAFTALTSPLLKERRILPGDEVITLACGFPTTVAPIVQYGARPVFIDVTLTYANADTSMLEEAYSDKTRAVMMAHTLGNPFDLDAVTSFCKKHNLWLIEDNCDALGSTYTLNGKTGYTGTFGDIGTSSFYPPHHMTMGEGGAVYTDNPLLHRIINSLRDWGRDCICPPGHDNSCGHRFDGHFGELPEGYDHKYVYSHLGYNLKATDMQAAIGCAQLEKMTDFIEKRRRHFSFLKEALSDQAEYFELPEATPGSDPSWFGFLLICREGIKRNAVVRYLEDAGVQTRMLFAGNLLRHPCFTDDPQALSRVKTIGSLANTDAIMNRAFWIGVYPGMTDKMLEYMAAKIKEAVQGDKACGI